MSVKLTLTGFDDYIKKLRKANANVQKVTEEAILKSGAVVNSNLSQQIKKEYRLTQDTKDAMLKDMKKPEIAYSSDRIVVGQAGIKIGNKIDPKDLSGGFISLFNEYGTINRKTKSGRRTGRLEEIEFTRRAIKKSASQVRKLQQGILEKALKELDG